jgi:hydrogenase/urease accessory protein HupE
MRWIVPALALVAPQAANAHLISTRFGEFYSGLLHPLTTLVHLVPWLALAMFAAFQGRYFARRTLLAFPLIVAAGVLVGFAIPGFDNVLILNVISFVVLGGLVSLSIKIPTTVGLGIITLFGLSHGYANGDFDLANGSLFLYTCGVTTAAYLISALGAAAAVSISEHANWGKIAVRALGSWILAAGLIYGGFELMAISSA